jgi:hypothetical protein
MSTDRQGGSAVPVLVQSAFEQILAAIIVNQTTGCGRRERRDPHRQRYHRRSGSVCVQQARR